MGPMRLLQSACVIYGSHQPWQRAYRRSVPHLKGISSLIKTITLIGATASPRYNEIWLLDFNTLPIFDA